MLEAARSRVALVAPHVRRWAFALVPLVALAELVAHVVQVASVAPRADWEAARDAVREGLRADDLVVFSPGWTDPVGREVFGPELATFAREARPDESRFARAFEVSVRGEHLPALAGWATTGERRFGGVTVRELANPSPARPKAVLVDRFDPKHVTVTRLDGSGETDCAFSRGVANSGGTIVPMGLAVPADKFQCTGGAWVGLAVLHDLDHRPRQCIAAIVSAGATLRVRFADVPFGASVRGHHGLQSVHERAGKGGDVVLEGRAGGHALGRFVHHDTAGWVGWEAPTTEMAGKTGELVFELGLAPGASDQGRQYCFEADTR